MSNVKQVSVPVYGAGHTKLYTKSVVSDFLIEKVGEDDAIHINSDIHLLLRQKNLHNTIGRDVLRNYFEDLDTGAPASHSFSDDELFSLIEPKGINTITDAYEFSKYLQKNSDTLKKKFDELKKSHTSLSHVYNSKK